MRGRRRRARRAMREKHGAAGECRTGQTGRKEVKGKHMGWRIGVKSLTGDSKKRRTGADRP
eukprot:6194167-Pleurochrysis_carterae.AAC.4